MKIKTALISVSEKDKLNDILKVLNKYKINIISSGGTFKRIRSLGYKCLEVSDYTKFPEILEGRVKTLHPRIHSGILFKRDKNSHKKLVKKMNIKGIDLVITNFYPFKKIASKKNNHNKIIENIDIGGPTLARSAAKNYKDVTVITKIEQYKELIKELIFFKGGTSFKFRQKMSREAFGETASYDSTIYNYLNSNSKVTFPKKFFQEGELIQKLRYGENPHQLGAIYGNHDDFRLHKLQGKELSYNNYNDIFACLNLSKKFPKDKGVVIVKHTNLCGVSIENNKLKSYLSAKNCDPLSAFGGVLACNFKLNNQVAKEISKKYYEVVIANGFQAKTQKILKSKKNLILIDSSEVKLKKRFSIKSGINSFLTQTEDNLVFNKKNFRVVSKAKPTKKIMEQLLFSFNVCRSTKSNAIVIAQNYKTLGIGSGQPSRIDSCKIAIKKMNKFKQYNMEDPLVAASDAFFPFIDGIEILVQAGVTAVIQPYGSIRDREIIKYADEMGIVLIFSKTRHFNH